MISPDFRHSRSCTARGFTLLELVVVIIIIAVLILVAASKLLKLREQAEQAAVTGMIGNLRSALGMQVANKIVKQDWTGLRRLAGSNPMDLLVSPPANYLGSLADADPGAIAGQQWYFDRRDHALVYRLAYPEHFHTSLAGPPRVRLAIRLFYIDTNHNGVYDAGIDILQGVDLVPLEHFAWRYGQRQETTRQENR